MIKVTISGDDAKAKTAFAILIRKFFYPFTNEKIVIIDNGKVVPEVTEKFEDNNAFATQPIEISVLDK